MLKMDILEIEEEKNKGGGDYLCYKRKNTG